jgi:hypothetical protein
MWLYRGNARLHRTAHGFGLRNKFYAMRAMPRMWLYRGYALLHRVTPGVGLRRKLGAFRTRLLRSLRSRATYI